MEVSEATHEVGTQAVGANFFRACTRFPSYRHAHEP